MSLGLNGRAWELSTEKTFQVLCLGLNSRDYMCLAEEPFQPGGKVRLSRMEPCGGGQAATCSCALSRLGRKTAYAGVCGDDEAGLLVAPGLKAYGVNPAGLVVKPGVGSQQAFITVEPKNGERGILWYRDDACVLTPDDLDPELIASAQILHLDGHFLEASLTAARIAKKNNVLVSLDGERIYPETRELVALSDVVMGCEDYAQRLFQEPDPIKALDLLADSGPAWAGRTMGQKGSEMICMGERFMQPAFNAQCLDTTGAGDVFHAGLIHAVLNGQGPQEALAAASAAAAFSLRGLGGRGALPSAMDLADVLKKGLV